MQQDFIIVVVVVTTTNKLHCLIPLREVRSNYYHGLLSSILSFK